MTMKDAVAGVEARRTDICRKRQVPVSTALATYVPRRARLRRHHFVVSALISGQERMISSNLALTIKCRDSSWVTSYP